MGGKNKLLAGIFIIGCIVIIGVAATINILSKASTADDDVMYQGVQIGGVDVGGMTKEEAAETINKHIEDMVNRPVKDKEYNLSFTLDKDAVQKFVEEKCTVFNVSAKNSRLKYRKNGKFKATKDRTGLKLQVAETTDRIIEAVEGNLTDESVEVEAVVQTTEPKYTREVISRCKDMIGSYSTTFSTSTAARANNVQTAAKYINGTILYPGKVFSTIKVIKDRTEENGYQSAPEYSSGKVVDGIGGGVCQVSTTLYNAVLNAELEVVERSPHSMVVGYVAVSRDAAISGTYKDFKFKNNTDVPIYIWADASGGTLTFRIYGEETRPKNRKIEFEPEILETIQPGADIITEDKSLPSSYRSVTQSAHVGYRAKLWKVIYIDGKEKERKELNTSTYNAEPQYVTVGNQGGSQTAEPSGKPGASKEPDNPEATKKPQATKKPEARGDRETRSDRSTRRYRTVRRNR